MFMFGDEQRNEDVHVEETSHDYGLRPVTVCDSIHIFDGQQRGAVARRKHGNASIKSDAGICNTAEKCFDELIDSLSGLVGQLCEAGFQGDIYGDRGGWHL